MSQSNSNSQRRGGPIAGLKFLIEKRMITPKYGLLLARLIWRKYLTPSGWRMHLSGMLFLGSRVAIQIGKRGRIGFGRWVWIGHGTKLRCHEGEIYIGSKTVMGQDCTLSAYRHIHVGEQCIFADHVMLIDFDHSVVDVEVPVRRQGIYMRDVDVGSNVWIGHGAMILRGVSVGDNAIIGAGAVVTKDVPPNAVAAGVPARVIRMREAPKSLSW